MSPFPMGRMPQIDKAMHAHAEAPVSECECGESAENVMVREQCARQNKPLKELNAVSHPETANGIGELPWPYPGA